MERLSHSGEKYKNKIGIGLISSEKGVKKKFAYIDPVMSGGGDPIGLIYMSGESDVIGRQQHVQDLNERFQEGTKVWFAANGQTKVKGIGYTATAVVKYEEATDEEATIVGVKQHWAVARGNNGLCLSWDENRTWYQMSNGNLLPHLVVGTAVKVSTIPQPPRGPNGVASLAVRLVFDVADGARPTVFRPSSAGLHSSADRRTPTPAVINVSGLVLKANSARVVIYAKNLSGLVAADLNSLHPSVAQHTNVGRNEGSGMVKCVPPSTWLCFNATQLAEQNTDGCTWYANNVRIVSDERRPKYIMMKKEEGAMTSVKMVQSEGYMLQTCHVDGGHKVQGILWCEALGRVKVTVRAASSLHRPAQLKPFTPVRFDAYAEDKSQSTDLMWNADGVEEMMREPKDACSLLTIDAAVVDKVKDASCAFITHHRLQGFVFCGKFDFYKRSMDLVKGAKVRLTFSPMAGDSRSRWRAVLVTPLVPATGELRGDSPGHSVDFNPYADFGGTAGPWASLLSLFSEEAECEDDNYYRIVKSHQTELDEAEAERRARAREASPVFRDHLAHPTLGLDEVYSERPPALPLPEPMAESPSPRPLVEMPVTPPAAEEQGHFDQFTGIQFHGQGEGDEGGRGTALGRALGRGLHPRGRQTPPDNYPGRGFGAPRFANTAAQMPGYAPAGNPPPGMESSRFGVSYGLNLGSGGDTMWTNTGQHEEWDTAAAEEAPPPQAPIGSSRPERDEANSSEDDGASPSPSDPPRHDRKEPAAAQAPSEHPHAFALLEKLFGDREIFEKMLAKFPSHVFRATLESGPGKITPNILDREDLFNMLASNSADTLFKFLQKPAQ